MLSSGTVMLLMMLGTARLRIRLFKGFRFMAPKVMKAIDSNNFGFGLLNGYKIYLDKINIIVKQ